jgi:hypothetical protein
LNPNTVGQNIFGLTYAGGNNPISYNLRPNYSYVPTSAADFPAIGHDRRYDSLNISGWKGVVFDTRSTVADWQFVGEEITIFGDPWANYLHPRNQRDYYSMIHDQAYDLFGAKGPTSVIFNLNPGVIGADLSFGQDQISTGIANRDIDAVLAGTTIGLAGTVKAVISLGK